MVRDRLAERIDAACAVLVLVALVAWLAFCLGCSGDGLRGDYDRPLPQVEDAEQAEEHEV